MNTNNDLPHAAKYEQVPEFQNPSQLDINAELSQLAGGGFFDTHSRFSLVRPGLSGDTYARDIVPESEDSEGESMRMLVVNREDVGIEIYNNLHTAGVSQLPLKDYTESGAAFGVPHGAKRLSGEVLNSGRKSSGTYISDNEVYVRAGMMYGDAWRATGALLLDGETDNALDHLAVVNFADEEGVFLYFCPPYSGSAQIEDPLVACHFFGQSLATLDPELAAAAVAGFAYQAGLS